MPAAFKTKIDRYLNFWREKYKGEWPVYPDPIPSAPKLTSSERLSDGLYFRLLRRLDDFTAAVYCWAPIGLLRKYRQSRHPPSGQPGSGSESPVREQSRV